MTASAGIYMGSLLVPSLLPTLKLKSDSRSYYSSMWTLMHQSCQCTNLLFRMCVTITKEYQNCKANPHHLFYQDLMCEFGRKLNPQTWCPYDYNAYSGPRYPAANPAVTTATQVDCPSCTSTRVYD